MKAFLADCAAIEENVARIYRVMAKNPEVSRELRETLLTLAEDEDRHAEKIHFALRLMREQVIEGYKLPYSRVKELLAESQGILNRMKTQPFGEEEALMTMIRLERDFCQVHVEAVAHFKDPKMLELFEALAGDDESHRATLDNYLARVSLRD